jgi:hypothetical protein
MEGQQSREPAPPGQLRPGQLGIVVIGRVIFGHISATLADLAARGFARVEELPGDGKPDWLVTDMRDQVPDGPALLGFEITLLDGLFAGQPAARLSAVSQALVPTLNHVRAQLRRDAVRHGRLRRWQRERRTAGGERLLAQIETFRKDLRALAAAGKPDALAPGLVPYAMIFGFRAPPAATLAPAARTGQGRDTEIAWSQTDRFILSWQAACAGFSAQPGRSHGHHPGTGPNGDFVQQWSGTRDHSHGSHRHGLGHDGYGSHGYDGSHSGHGGHGGIGGGHSGH